MLGNGSGMKAITECSKRNESTCVFLYLVHNCLFTLIILQGHAQVNFLSTLLRVTMSDQLDLPVRQAGESNLKMDYFPLLYVRWT